LMDADDEIARPSGAAQQLQQPTTATPAAPVETPGKAAEPRVGTLGTPVGPGRPPSPLCSQERVEQKLPSMSGTLRVAAAEPRATPSTPAAGDGSRPVTPECGEQTCLFCLDGPRSHVHIDPQTRAHEPTRARAKAARARTPARVAHPCTHAHAHRRACTHATLNCAAHAHEAQSPTQARTRVPPG
jgi:hypothetical protein